MPLYVPDKALTILRDPKPPEIDRAALALAALAWMLTDEARAQRFLALTGLTPDALRNGLDDLAVLGAVIDFLIAHEPDLLAAAAELGVDPAVLAGAGGELR